MNNFFCFITEDVQYVNLSFWPWSLGVEYWSCHASRYYYYIILSILCRILIGYCSAEDFKFLMSFSIYHKLRYHYYHSCFYHFDMSFCFCSWLYTRFPVGLNSGPYDIGAIQTHSLVWSAKSQLSLVLAFRMSLSKCVTSIKCSFTNIITSTATWP